MNATPPGHGNSTWLVKKVLGEVPVAEDGSVAVNLPVRTPFYLQLLDAKGRMVQTMRSWTILQPGEVVSCVGCHESLNDAPDYRMEHRPVAQTTLPPAKDGFSFPRDVQPILDRRCVRCHNPMNDKIPDLTATCVRDPQAKRWWTQSYLSLTHARFGDKTMVKKYGGAAMWWENLWVGDSTHPMLNWIDNGTTTSLVPPDWRGSRTSRLFTEKLDKGHAPGLTDAELRTLACWVDLGVPFCGAYDERADWTPEDYAFWNRGLLRRARFRTDGEPDGDAAWAWSTNVPTRLVGSAAAKWSEPIAVVTNAAAAPLLLQETRPRLFHGLALGDPARQAAGHVVQTQGALAGYCVHLYGTKQEASTYRLVGGTLSLGVQRPGLKAQGQEAPLCALVLEGVSGKPAVFELSGGVLDCEQSQAMMQIGCYSKLSNEPHASCLGVFNQTGGEVRLNNYAVVGRFAGDVGWYNQTGGSFRLTNPTACVYVGEEGEGHLRVGGTGYFSTPHLSLGRADSCWNCSVTIEGNGRLVSGDITVKDSVGARVNFNGGTLATYESNHRLVPFIQPTIATVVQAGGARIDVGLNTWAELPGALTEDPASVGGGLTKAGYGMLVLLGSNTYTGPTRVEGGCLLVKDATAVAKSASVQVAGEASFGVFGENLAAAQKALGGKIMWGLGSSLVIDTRNGSVKVSGKDLLGARRLEKLGANDLVITSSPAGVSEIRVHGGRLLTTGPDVLPAGTKVLQLGGTFGTL